MNEEAQKVFNTIIEKDVPALTPGDIEFLQARRQYLSRDQKKKFGEVLKQEVEPQPEAPENVPPSEHPADKTVEDDGVDE